MMKHYVLGFVFNRQRDEVLLIEKKRPTWQAGHWNGIGGKIEPTDASPLQAMQRKCAEEINCEYNWELAVIFVCPGGTVYVYKADSGYELIEYEQIEDEILKVWPVDALPNLAMNNLNWLIPLCLSTCQFPLVFYDTVKCSGK